MKRSHLTLCLLLLITPTYGFDFIKSTIRDALLETATEEGQLLHYLESFEAHFPQEASLFSDVRPLIQCTHTTLFNQSDLITLRAYLLSLNTNHTFGPNIITNGLNFTDLANTPSELCFINDTTCFPHLPILNFYLSEVQLGRIEAELHEPQAIQKYGKAILGHCVQKTLKNYITALTNLQSALFTEINCQASSPE